MAQYTTVGKSVWKLIILICKELLGNNKEKDHKIEKNNQITYNLPERIINRHGKKMCFTSNKKIQKIIYQFSLVNLMWFKKIVHQ